MTEPTDAASHSGDGTEIPDLARTVADGDRPSAPVPRRLRPQWNVPEGVPPYIPLWFAALVVGLFLVPVVIALVR